MKFKKTIMSVSIGLAFIASNSFAAGFQLNAQSATGLGRAYAGDAVIADNASALARNPAAMSLFKTISVSGGISVIASDITLKNATVNGAAIPDETGIGSTSLIPNFFVIVPIDDKFTAGFGVYAAFGTETEFPDNFAATIYGGTTKIQALDYQLSGSYRINDNFSIGAGLDLIAFDGKIIRKLPTGPGTQIDALNIDSKTYGLGYNIGVVYEVDSRNRYGIGYHYYPDLSTDEYVFGGAKIDAKAKLSLPDMVEFSGFNQLTDMFALSYSAQYINWSEFDALRGENAPPSAPNGILKAYDWRNTWHFSVGGTFTLNDKLTLRTGMMYDMGAVDEIKQISIPDSDRIWFSVGASYNVDKHSTVDFGLTYLKGTDVDVHENTSPIGQDLLGTTRANAWLYGVEYNYKF